MEKTDLVIEPITDCEIFNKLIAKVGGWDECCKKYEVEIVPEDDEWPADFIKDGIPYRLVGGQPLIINYDHDWYHDNF